MQDVQGWSRVPPVLGHKPGEGFRPVVRGDWARPGSDPVSVQGLYCLGPIELESTVALPEVPFILARVRQTRADKIARTAAHQNFCNGLCGGM
jgi:hypothetical protein